ncbi:uncharacterized protein V6R79_009642 [Siganus canaliculatus]
MLGWNNGSNNTTSFRDCPEGLTECLFEKVVTMDYMVYFNFFGCVLVPLLAMLVIYVHIFMAARRQLRLIGLKVANMPAPGEITSTSSSASRSTLQKEVHAAKSLAIIVGLFALCWLPLHIINCYHYLCKECDRLHLWMMNIAIILSHANSVVNPFIYAYRIREFRQTFRRILYQHILGRKDGLGFGAGRGVVSCSIMRTSSRASKDGSLCETVVNSYVLNHSPHRTPPTTTQASGCWTSEVDAAPSSSIPNGRQLKDGSLTAMQQQQQPHIMTFAAHDRMEPITYMKGKTDVLEVKDSGSCIAFVNVQALSLKQTDHVQTSELTEVS